MSNDRTCIDCKNWQVMPSEPGYSSWTPGSDGYWECRKGYWTMSFGDDQSEIRSYLLKARTCAAFDPADYADPKTEDGKRL